MPSQPASSRRYNVRMTRHALVLLLLCPLAAAGAEWRYGDEAAGASDGQAASSNASGGQVAGSVPGTAPQPAVTMTQVRQTLGAPEKILEGVGDPPITRWQYPGYVVYFENDRVITSVAGRI